MRFAMLALAEVTWAAPAAPFVRTQKRGKPLGAQCLAAPQLRSFHSTLLYFTEPPDVPVRDTADR